MLEAGSYTCAYNLLALDFDYSPMKNVPISMGAVNRWRQQAHSQAVPNLSTIFNVSLMGAEAPTDGKIKLLSPMEIVDAFLFKV